MVFIWNRLDMFLKKNTSHTKFTPEIEITQNDDMKCNKKIIK